VKIEIELNVNINK